MKLLLEFYEGDRTEPLMRRSESLSDFGNNFRRGENLRHLTLDDVQNITETTPVLQSYVGSALAMTGSVRCLSSLERSAKAVSTSLVAFPPTYLCLVLM